MPGAIALPVAGTFVALCLDQLIGFMVKQCVECFFNAVSDKILRWSFIRVSFNCIMLSDIILCLLGILVMVT